jgi:subtilisin family serine protease
MKTGLFTFVERDGVVRSTGTANDTYFSSQWHLSAIQAPSAWDITTGNSNVVVAVVDTGADWAHPDLAGNLVTGWSFLTGTSNTQDSGGNSGHGTATSGTIAAVSNNNVGVAGVSWNNKVMPLQVLDSSGGGSVSNLANAITYAADHGARIVNASVGTQSASSALQSAVDYAWNKGTVVFAAAGNYATSTPVYPAACNNAVAVSATDPNGVFHASSSYGNWIDVSAPGSGILTTSLGGSYGSWSGTSFASPIAAAVGALVLSVKPGLSASQLVSLLEKNADDLGTAGLDDYFGYGQVNAYKSVLAAGSAVADTTPPSVSISSPGNGATVSSSVSIQGSATDNTGITSIQFYVDGQVIATAAASPFSFAWNTGNYANGSHTVQVTASDATGNIGSSSISLNVNNVVTSDTTPPVVSILSPISGSSLARVTGNLQISASVTDNVAVSQVSFYVDNSLKCTDSSAPYSCTWNTKKAASGAHTITVTGWDTSGNFTSASTTVYK